MERAQLEKLISFVGEIASLPENEWFKEELLIKMGFSVESSIVPAPILKVYEQCVRDIIQSHAEKFYEGLKIPDKIKLDLIKDYVRMENFRREDRFDDFCLAAFQQLEQLLNYCIQIPDCINFIRLNLNSKTSYFVNFSTHEEIESGGTVQGLLFYNDVKRIEKFLDSDPRGWTFKYKFRVVLFYFGFGGRLKGGQGDYDRLFELGDALYLGRNLNHRGTELRHNAEKLDTLKSEEHKYYFKFLGFLEEFISRVNQQLISL